MWLVFICGTLGLYFFNPQFFTAENIKKMSSDNTALNLTIYFILGTLRGFTLIPSTPMVLAGALFLPLWPLFLVNQLCVFTSSTIVYYWGKYLEFDVYFSLKFPTEMEKLKVALKGKEIPVVIIWSFFPFVPTDIICYTAEIVRVKLWKCLVGVGIGEGILCATYIWGSSSILQWLI
ncbi:hypothetical protein UABAM_00771 [Candidatus Uabimicrobium amorphum]|uniref:VTT domain-containing protein n=2 Tax=Uabimicrobium amorphum TaxID=2596890 RepID=A0A5S9IIF7_UABAM|nr:hypothetical protein UABAM_00771 [Candidatus Uabimicrobium amorphum]